MKWAWKEAEKKQKLFFGRRNLLRYNLIIIIIQHWIFSYSLQCFVTGNRLAFLFPLFLSDFNFKLACEKERIFISSSLSWYYLSGKEYECVWIDFEGFYVLSVDYWDFWVMSKCCNSVVVVLNDVFMKLTVGLIFIKAERAVDS